MIVADTKRFLIGLALAASFLLVLGTMFMPLFWGGNAFQASDQLFNSIAKGSSYYIPELQADAKQLQGSRVEATIDLKQEDRVGKAITILTKAGIKADCDGTKLTLSGDLGLLLGAALTDSDALFWGRGTEVSAKYGFEEREAVYIWWNTLRELEKDLKRQEKFKEAAALEHMMMKGVEVGYNFYGIKAKKVSENIGILSFALVFYLVYTLWWGYAMMYLFDGVGLQMKAHGKKEM